MNNIDSMFTISLVGGLIVMFFGRRLFWLYIGLVGVLAGFELAHELFPQQSQWIFLLVGLVLGVCMALLAMAFQYAAIALAGFAGGAYLALQIGVVLPIVDPTQIPGWVLVIPGILGAIICVGVFEPALIVLSSLTGAALLVQLVAVEPLLQNLLLAALAVLGMGFQFVNYRRKA
jgi:hypothetical protein